MPEISLGKFNLSIILLLFLASCHNDSQNQHENKVDSISNNKQVDQHNNQVITEYGVDISKAFQLIAKGKTNEAKSILAAEEQKKPFDTQLLNELAKAFLSSMDTSEATNRLEQSIKIDPTQSQAFFELGYIYAAKKDTNALIIAEQFIKQKGQEQQVAHGYFLKGIYFVNSNKPSLALNSFTQAILNDYTNTDAYIEKAILLYDLKKFKESLSVLNKSILIDKFQADAYYWMGKNYEAIGNKVDAKFYYEQTILLAPDYEIAKQSLEEIK